jgi:nucleoside-diphosphate-sugar epimerase
MNILITGGNGYIGANLNQYLKDKYTITTINRQTFDLTDREKTKNWFDNKFFDVVIHTAIKGGSRLIADDSSVLDNNINMYYNILSCRDNFNKFINIGSGAEIYDPNSYYGLSKKLISTSILDKKNFYTLRIYGLFDEHELDSRFIKQNIKRYIKKNDIIIHKNKLMDFIYFQDFLQIIIRYIEDIELPKEIDCSYIEKFSLKDIAETINQLDNYHVNIQILDANIDKDYIGSPTPSNIAINFIGLKQGIINSYREIKNEKNMVCSK